MTELWFRQKDPLRKRDKILLKYIKFIFMVHCTGNRFNVFLISIHQIFVTVFTPIFED